MITPQIGQRWLVDTDASLGLGIVVDCQPRRLTLEFPAVGESRHYSLNNAPLTRAVFSEGETIETQDGNKHQIAQVENINDLLIYISENGEPIPESQLASTLQFNHPYKRLLAGQLDKPAWFDVREQLTRAQQTWRRSDFIGLLGARITLNPHQLYVAHSATSRNPVRVLLADEVGLGKTIEAGLILQRLQLQEWVNRTLILVPEALCVQWFIELLRCFSIHSVLVDEDTELDDNRVFIAPHQLLNEPRALEADPWDLVIVDEAHHFDLEDDNPEGEHLRQLADHSAHLLLLSATPERLGLASHFYRMELLDGEKFFDFDDFQQAYNRYQDLADDMQALFDEPEEAVSQTQRDRLEQHFQLRIDPQMPKPLLAELLLDTHGTGRVVYRNTRHGIAGFPERRLITHTIEDDQQKLLWLAEFVKSHRNEKLLLITREQAEVLRIKEWLYRQTGIDCPVFHEAMTLVERDRAAAYFADPEESTPMLLCSEIGSEGRNFQFCHRLICWDLPEHPDVLEQRIGRLDRIGQTRDIEIHLCLVTEEDKQRLHWFHDLLNSIEQINPAAGAIHDQWFAAYCDNPAAVEADVKRALQNLLENLEQGRDRLLELNSCRQPEADALVNGIIDEARANHPQELFEKITDLLNLHYEQLADNRFRLVPSDQMLVPAIPGIPPEGCELTFDRATAVAREDIAFITWDHPLMQGLADIVNLSELGVASVGILPSKRLRPGMLFAEVLFTLSIQSSHARDIEPYLTQSGFRVVVTQSNAQNLHQSLPSDQLEHLVVSAPKPVQKALIKDLADQISELITKAEQLAAGEMETILQTSRQHLLERSTLEVTRLQQLQQHNPDISEGDVAAVQSYYHTIADSLSHACQPSLTAIRLLVTDKA